MANLELERLDGGGQFTAQLSKEEFQQLQLKAGEQVFVELKNVKIFSEIFRFSFAPELHIFRHGRKTLSQSRQGGFVAHHRQHGHVIITFLITGKLKWAFYVSGVELFTKIFLYYVHERVWHKINMGQN